MAQENKATLLFVGLMLFGALVGVFYSVVPLERMFWWLLAGGFEGWTILNHRKADTISEAIWELSKRPLVPWLFGALTVYGYQVLSIAAPIHPIELGAWLGMQGHFFWQAHQDQAQG